MNNLIAGSTISDLGRNALIANEQEGARSQAIVNQLLAYLAQKNAARDAAQRNQLGRDEMGQRYGFLGNQLASNERLSANDLAAKREMSMLPYTKSTVADTEHNQLIKAAQDADAAYKARILDMQQNNPMGFLDPATRGKIIMDAQQKREMADAATNRANQLLQASIGTEQPALVDRLDTGSGWRWWAPGANFTRGDAQTAAADIIAGKTRDDGAFNSGKEYWDAKHNQLVRGVLDSLGEGASYTTYDPAQRRFVPSDFAAKVNPFQLLQRPPTAPVATPSVGTNAPKILIQGGQRFSISPDGAVTFLGPAQ